MLVQRPVRSAVPADTKLVQVLVPVNKAEQVHKLKPERPLVLRTVSLGAMVAGPTAVLVPARRHGERAAVTAHALTAVGRLVPKQRKRQ